MPVQEVFSSLIWSKVPKKTGTRREASWNFNRNFLKYCKTPDYRVYFEEYRKLLYAGRESGGV